MRTDRQSWHTLSVVVLALALIYSLLGDVPLTGTIDKVTFDVRPPSDPADHARLEQQHHAGRQIRHIES